MRLLLDTHVLLAQLETGSVVLSAAMQVALVADEAELFVSTASLWEISIKVRSGKLAIGMTLEQLPEACEAAAFAILSITPRHVLADVTPEPGTRDPFDRLLLAQAKVESLRLVTVDRALATHPLAWRPAP